MVTNADDNGPGTLRQAIMDAPDGGTITFAVSGIIFPTSEITINKNLTITGPGANTLVVYGNGDDRVFNITNPAITVTISGLNVGGGSPGAAGADGGAIYNAATLNLIACSISNSYSGYLGGTNGGRGGGIFNSGTLSLTACTVSDNSSGNGTVKGGDGGGIFNSGDLTLINCTITRNGTGDGQSDRGGQGGGISSPGSLTMIACTVTANTCGSGQIAAPSGGGIFAGGSAKIWNSIIASNTVSALGTGLDVSGNFNSLGHNLIGSTNGSSGFGVSGDLTGTILSPLFPFLGSFTNNGGPTLSCVLLTGSPAIDAGDDSIMSSPYTITRDQCGQRRKWGAQVDIGAFEVAPVLTLPPHGRDFDQCCFARQS